MRHFTSLALSACLLAGTVFADTAHASGGVRGLTIAEIIALSGEGFDQNPYDYDTLRTVLDFVLEQKPDSLLAALGDPNAEPKLTLFAPNDLAFVRFARDFGYEGGDEEGAFAFLEELGLLEDVIIPEQILSYHVVPGRISLFQFVLAALTNEPLETLLVEPSLGTLSVQPFLFGLIDRATTLENPRLFFPVNVRASNGVVHTLNRVLRLFDE